MSSSEKITLKMRYRTSLTPPPIPDFQIHKVVDENGFSIYPPYRFIGFDTWRAVNPDNKTDILVKAPSSIVAVRKLTQALEHIMGEYQEPWPDDEIPRHEVERFLTQ